MHATDIADDFPVYGRWLVVPFRPRRRPQIVGPAAPKVRWHSLASAAAQRGVTP